MGNYSLILMASYLLQILTDCRWLRQLTAGTYRTINHRYMNAYNYILLASHHFHLYLKSPEVYKIYSLQYTCYKNATLVAFVIQNIK